MKGTRNVTSILYTALRQGNVHVVRTMLNSHSLTKGEQSIALRNAIAAGQLPVVQAIVEHSRLEGHDLKLDARLCQAIRLRNEQIALWLLEQGASVEAADARGNSALQLAVNHQRLTIVLHLLENGASVNGQDSLGNSIAMTAAANSSAVILQLLLQYNASPDRALARAVLNNHYSNVRLLLMRGANPNEANERGITPLMLSMLHENVPVIKLLIQFGADPNRQDESGDTALIYAARHCGEGLFHLLMKLGASAEITNRHGENAASLYAARFRSARSPSSFT